MNHTLHIALVTTIASAFASSNASAASTTAPARSAQRPQRPVVEQPTVDPARVNYVAPGGRDSAAGTRTAPWRTLRRAFAALRPGDELRLRAGTYRESELRIDVAGTASDPVCIRAEPGEAVVIDGSWPQFEVAPQAQWELVDGRLGVYRSVDKFVGIGKVFGYVDVGGQNQRLVPYDSAAPLHSARLDYSSTVPYYAGAGVYWDPATCFVEVRLQSGASPPSPSPAPTPDPRATPIILFREAPVLDIAATHLTIEGIRIVHGEFAVHVAGSSHHLAFRDCSVRAGRYEFVVRRGAHHVLFDRVVVDGAFPEVVARSDVKMPQNASPAHSLQGCAVELASGVAVVEFARCRFANLFDAIDAVGIADLDIHDCVFEGIRDDAIELGTSCHRVEVHDNQILDSTAGVSWTESGVAPPNGIGTVFVHHNVIDTSRHHRYARNDPQNLLPPRWLGPRVDGMATGPAFATHSLTASSGPAPWKIYYNTIVVAEDVDSSGSGASYPIARMQPGCPHEVLNNLFVILGDDCVWTHARLDDGSQVFDGNHYYRARQTLQTGLFEVVASRSATADYVDLLAFLTAPQWLDSRIAYAPGWEAAGSTGDPGLDHLHRPDPAGPAMGPGVDLRSRGWPGGDWQPCRGAVRPR